MGFLAPVAAAGAAAGGGIGSIGTIATLLGGVVSAVGAIQGGQAAAAQANYQARVAEMNAEIERDNAERARDASQIEQEQSDLDTVALLGQQISQQSASGVALGSRSSLGARRSARMIGRRDALNIRQAGEIEAFNNLVGAANFDANAGLQRAAGRNAITQGFLGAAGSLIGSASSLSLGARRRVTGTGAPIPRSRPV